MNAEPLAPTAHEAVYIGSGMSDQYRCTCGWEGPGYWDGAHWAYEAWEKHVSEVRHDQLVAQTLGLPAPLV